MRCICERVSSLKYSSPFSTKSMMSQWTCMGSIQKMKTDVIMVNLNNNLCVCFSRRFSAMTCWHSFKETPPLTEKYLEILRTNASLPLRGLRCSTAFGWGRVLAEKLLCRPPDKPWKSSMDAGVERCNNTVGAVREAADCEWPSRNAFILRCSMCLGDSNAGFNPLIISFITGLSGCSWKLILSLAYKSELPDVLRGVDASTLNDVVAIIAFTDDCNMDVTSCLLLLKTMNHVLA